MSLQNPTMGEITMFAGNFAPRFWAFCDGQYLDIANHQALFSILGTMYGGDGRVNFRLPDLRSRFPRHCGTGPGLSPVQQGHAHGVETHTLTTNEMPIHSHPHTHTATLHAELAQGDALSPQDRMLGFAQTGSEIYTDPDPAQNRTMAPESIVVDQSAVNAGGSQPFWLMNPWLGVQFIIAIEGDYPARS